MDSTVTISRRALAAIGVHAASSGDEVCGLLLGPSALDVTEARRCRNVDANPAHRFEIDPAALLAAHRASRGDGPRVVGHYHSHPSGLAEPSIHDAADAVPDTSLWLIVAGGAVTAWRAVRDGAVHDRFDPVVIRPV